MLRNCETDIKSIGELCCLHDLTMFEASNTVKQIRMSRSSKGIATFEDPTLYHGYETSWLDGMYSCCFSCPSSIMLLGEWSNDYKKTNQSPTTPLSGRCTLLSRFLLTSNRKWKKKTIPAYLLPRTTLITTCSSSSLLCRGWCSVGKTRMEGKEYKKGTFMKSW